MSLADGDLLRAVLTAPLDAVPPVSNEQRRDALLARWARILKDIGHAQAKILQEGVSPGGQELQLRDEQAKVHALLNAQAFARPAADGSFAAAYATAEQAVDLFELKPSALYPASKVRDLQAGEVLGLAEAASAALDPEASGEEREQVVNANSALTAALKPPVSAGALAKGQADLEELKRLIAGIGTRCEADRSSRRAERGKLVQRVADAKPHPDATAEEKARLANLARPVEALAETPSEEQLAAAASAAETVEKEALALTQGVAERRSRFEKAAALLLRLKVDAPTLRAHQRAPAAEIKSVQDDSAKLRMEAAKFSDWAQVTSWVEGDLSGLDKSIAALEQRMADIAKATEERIQRVANAAGLATAAIEQAKGRAFSAGQKSALLAPVTLETGRFEKDVALADSVVAALDKQTAMATALSQALAGLAKRLAAVAEPSAASLSAKEKDTLKKAKEAAEKALDQVVEA